MNYLVVGLEPNNFPSGIVGPFASYDQADAWGRKTLGTGNDWLIYSLVSPS